MFMRSTPKGTAKGPLDPGRLADGTGSPTRVRGASEESGRKRGFRQDFMQFRPDAARTPKANRRRGGLQGRGGVCVARAGSKTEIVQPHDDPCSAVLGQLGQLELELFTGVEGDALELIEESLMSEQSVPPRGL